MKRFRTPTWPSAVCPGSSPRQVAPACSSQPVQSSGGFSWGRSLVGKLVGTLVGALAIGLSLASCQSTTATAPPEPEDRFEAAAVNPDQVVTGQTVYVPVYSYVYQRSTRNPVMQVSATLSIRNTDLTHPIILRSVQYYDTNGERLRNYLEAPIEMGSLSSADYLVETEDVSGGIGANFIVEWVATAEVSEPVIEALMISTTGAQGISFISPGRVIRRWEGEASDQTEEPQ